MVHKDKRKPKLNGLKVYVKIMKTLVQISQNQSKLNEKYVNCEADII